MLLLPLPAIGETQAVELRAGGVVAGPAARRGAVGEAAAPSPRRDVHGTESMRRAVLDLASPSAAERQPRTRLQVV
jgi:hypothetical protein